MTEKTLEIHLKEQKVELFRKVLAHYFEINTEAVKLAKAASEDSEDPNRMEAALHMQSYANGVQGAALMIMEADDLGSALLEAGMLTND